MQMYKNILNNKGFTMIEILIVAILIGVVSAIAIPAIVGLTDEAEDTQVVSNMNSLMSDMESFKTVNDEYPDDLVDDLYLSLNDNENSRRSSEALNNLISEENRGLDYIYSTGDVSINNIDEVETPENISEYIFIIELENGDLMAISPEGLNKSYNN